MTIDDLHYFQSLPLASKVSLTKQRIREWVREYGEDGVYVSFSGGKDSTVLLHIARQMYPNIKAVFIDTGLEYPEIRQFVKTFDNVDIIKPKLTFRQVVERFGYPVISKEVAENVRAARKYARENPEGIPQSQGKQRYAPGQVQYERITGTGVYAKGQKAKFDGTSWSDRSKFSHKRYQFFLEAPFEISSYCCRVSKKNPAHSYAHKTGRKPITAQMASESRLRTEKWLMNGCNGYDLNEPISNPMSFWFEEDVLLYCYLNHIEICSVYGDIVKDNEVEGQLDLADLGIFDLGRPALKTTGCARTGCVFCLFGIHLEKSPNRLEKLKETHPKLYDYVMRPEEEGGLGYKWKLDWINEHGGFDIKY